MNVLKKSALTLFLISAISQAQTLRGEVSQADVIVVAKVSSVERATTKIDFRNGLSLPADKVTIEVSKVLKGECETKITVFIPSGSLLFGETPRTANSPDFRVSSSGWAVWLLQKREMGNWFTNDHSAPETDSIRALDWRVNESHYAPMRVSVISDHTSIMPIDSPTVQLSQSPFVSLADLFANNAKASVDPEWTITYLARVRSLVPLHAYRLHLDHDGLMKGEDRRLLMSWYDDNFKTAFSSNNPKVRLNEIAVRMSFGETMIEDEWMTLYKQLPPDSDRIAPMIRKVANILYFAEFGDEARARDSFISLREADKSERKEILKVVRKRLGESHRLDYAILECVFGLYEKPTLNPGLSGTNALEGDLSQQHQALSDLIRNELDGEA